MMDFWKNQDLLSLPAQVFKVAVYLLAGPHTNVLGSFYVPVAYICDDLHLLRKSVVKAIAHLDRVSFLKYDVSTRYALILSLRASGALQNPNNLKCAIRELSQMPDSVPWKQELSLQLAEIRGQQDNADDTPLHMPNERQSNNGNGGGEGDGNGNRDRDGNAQGAETPASPAKPFSVSDFSSLPKSFRFPLKGGSTWTIDQVQVDNLQRQFPNIVVPVRLQKHLKWFHDNPRKRMSEEQTKIKIYDMLAEDNGEKTT